MQRLTAFVSVFFLASLALAQAASPGNQASSSPTAVKKVRVSTGVMLGMFDHKVMPVYPDEAMLKGIQGDTMFNIEVDETGKTVSATPTQGDPLLISASQEALEKSHFRPYLLNGIPVRVESQIGYRFRVEKNGSSVNGRVDCITQSN